MLDPCPQPSSWSPCSVSWLCSLLRQNVPIGWQGWSSGTPGLHPIHLSITEESIFSQQMWWKSWLWADWKGQDHILEPDRERRDPSYLNCLERGDKVVLKEKLSKQKTPTCSVGILTRRPWRSDELQVSSLKLVHSPGHASSLPRITSQHLYLLWHPSAHRQNDISDTVCSRVGNLKTFKAVPKIPDLMYFVIFFLKPLVMQLKKRN